MEKLLAIMARLRDPRWGCPWDRAQTFASIAPYTIEEAYEVADAIAQGDMNELREELGDLLFQVVFHAQMAKEADHFDFQDVARTISDKMLRRHPHVFEGVRVGSTTELRDNWERHKADERRLKTAGAKPSRLDGVARALPALSRAEKLQKRAAKVGFDWPAIAGVFDKVREELDEVAAALEKAPGSDSVREEIGDLLFSCTNLARHAGVDAESALRGSNDKFEHRFKAMEKLLSSQGKAPEEVGPEELDILWERVKAGRD